jgi:RNA polymerase sigma factor (sigma-70 family)
MGPVSTDPLTGTPASWVTALTWRKTTKARAGGMEPARRQLWHCAALAAAHDNAVMSAAPEPSGLVHPKDSAGHPEELAALRQHHHIPLRNALVARGATVVEAEDLLADLWGECVGQGDDHPSLLEKFSGRCPIQGWLLTVATRRLVDLKRREKRRGELAVGDDRSRDSHDRFDQVPGAEGTNAPLSDDHLVELLRVGLQAAFGRCPPDALLMLRLVFLNGLSQREIGRMWGWHESKVSRCLTQAMNQIEITTMNELRRRDPWLELTWADFVQLCESQRVGFL